MKIKITLTDDGGKIYEREIDFKQSLPVTKVQKTKIISDQWYKSGSTTDKVMKLIDEKFFNELRTISDIVNELKTKDYHLKPSDLTMTLRAMVRKGVLRKTKELQDGKKSKNWLYVKKM